MKTNRTFSMLKPDSIEDGYMLPILNKISDSGFKIIALKYKKMKREEAEEFYSIHSEKPFFRDLTEFMSSGPCMVLALKKENAVEEWRNTIGATNPDEAESGSIRKDFATSIGENAVHGSDSDENAKKEIGFFFSESELLASK